MDDDSRDGTSGLLGSVMRFKWSVLALVLLGTAAAYAVASQRPTLYRASASVLLTDPRTETVLTESRQSGGDPGRYVRNQAQFATSPPVLERAARLLGVPKEALAISAEAVVDVDSMIISAVDTDPQRAAAAADAVALSYEQVRTEQRAEASSEAIEQLQRARREVERQLVAIERSLAGDPLAPGTLAERDAATRQLEVLLTRERQLAVDTALFGGGVDLREDAEVPLDPFAPQPLRAASAGLVLSAALAAALAWWWNTRRPIAVPRTHIDRLLRAPMLGEIPRFSRHLGPFPAAVDPLSPEAETYQFLAAALVRELGKRGARSVLLTSAGSGDGKTATAVNLAVVANRDGHRLVLVDADVRARGLTLATEVAPVLGLQEIARDSVPVRHCLVTPDIPGLEGLRIAGMEPEQLWEDSVRFLRSPGFGRALSRMYELADFVVVDAPPVLAVADSFEMAPRIDAVLVVVGPTTSHDELREVKRRLDLAGADIVGYVMNRSGSHLQSYAYGQPILASGAADREPSGAADAPVTSSADAPEPPPEAVPAVPAVPAAPAAVAVPAAPAAVVAPTAEPVPVASALADPLFGELPPYPASNGQVGPGAVEDEQSVLPAGRAEQDTAQAHEVDEARRAGNRVVSSVGWPGHPPFVV